jgi:molybdenum cofactor cytidylyltransferase
VISCVILAAGASRRFGKAKLLEPLPCGEAVLHATVRVYASVFPSVLVVVQPDQPEVETLLSDLPVQTVQSPNWTAGMSQSLIAGVRANPSAAGWLIALGDMPHTRAETVGEIVSLAHAERIVQPSCNGRAGNPVLFGSSFYSELLTLRGDVGGKALLERYREQVITCTTSDFGVLHDIDRPVDLVRTI